MKFYDSRLYFATLRALQYYGSNTSRISIRYALARALLFSFVHRKERKVYSSNIRQKKSFQVSSNSEVICEINVSDFLVLVFVFMLRLYDNVTETV